MNIVFVSDYAVDGCKKKNIGKGFQMCQEHQNQYDKGEILTAFYGKKVQKKITNKTTKTIQQ